MGTEKQVTARQLLPLGKTTGYLKKGSQTQDATCISHNHVTLTAVAPSRTGKMGKGTVQVAVQETRILASRHRSSIALKWINQGKTPFAHYLETEGPNTRRNS